MSMYAGIAAAIAIIMTALKIIAWNMKTPRQRAMHEINAHERKQRALRIKFFGGGDDY